MSSDKSSASQAATYHEIGEFWDSHDLGEFWDQTRPAEFAVEIRPDATYYPVESGLSKRVREIARRRGVSAETLLKLWVQEKAAEVLTVGAAE